MISIVHVYITNMYLSSLSKTITNMDDYPSATHDLHSSTNKVHNELIIDNG